MVVHHDEVEREAGALAQHRTDGVADGADAVVHGDDDRCFVFELSGVEVRFFKLRGEVGAHFFQMFRAGLLHFHLPLPVARVHIVEETFAAGAHVVLHFGVQVFVDVYQRGALAQLQAQVVEAGVAIAGRQAGSGLFQTVGTQQPQGAEVEVIAQRAGLVVDDGRLAASATAQPVVVGVDQACARVFGDAHHPLQGKQAEAQVRFFEVEQCVVAVGVLRHAAHGLAGGEILYRQQAAARQRGQRPIGGQQPHFAYRIGCAQFGHGSCRLCFVGIGHKATDSFRCHNCIRFCFDIHSESFRSVRGRISRQSPTAVRAALISSSSKLIW